MEVEDDSFMAMLLDDGSQCEYVREGISEHETRTNDKASAGADMKPRLEPLWFRQLLDASRAAQSQLSAEGFVPKRIRRARWDM